jgi:hypothetical protein
MVKKPRLSIAVPIQGVIQGKFGSIVQAKMKRPAEKERLTIIMGGRRASGKGLFLFSLKAVK